jgi:hypothetical protein
VDGWGVWCVFVGCSVLVEGFWCFELVFDIRCILYYYYYILYYTYTIILYIILLYTILSSSSFPIFILYLSVLTYTYLYSSVLFFFSSSVYTLLFYSLPHPPPLLIHSILVGTYIRLFIFFYSPPHLSLLPIFSLQSFSPQPKYLTPHVLSEWMVEVCGGDLYRVQFKFMFWPRTFYRSGWLRCVVRICVVFGSGLCLEWCSSFWAGVMCWVLSWCDVRCYILYIYYYYYIIYYTYTIILYYYIIIYYILYYTIIYYTLPLLSLSPLPFLLQFYPPLLFILLYILYLISCLYSSLLILQFYLPLLFIYILYYTILLYTILFLFL